MVKCTLCGKDLPESEFSPSFLKRKQFQCKKCVYERYGKKAQKKYFDSLDELAEKVFDAYYGGYVIKILNFAKPNEFKYIITSTKGDSLYTNNKQEFIEYINRIISPE